MSKLDLAKGPSHINSKIYYSERLGPKVLPGGEIKCDPEIGKTAIQPEPAQTGDFSISGSRLISSLCTQVHYMLIPFKAASPYSQCARKAGVSLRQLFFTLRRWKMYALQ